MPLYAREYEIPGVMLLGARRLSDFRGDSEESWCRRDFAAIGIEADFVCDRIVRSTHAGTLRGLHCQAPPHAQARLLRCLRGAVYVATVDIRKGSSSYGRSCVVTLTADVGQQLFVPEGVLLGWLALEPHCDVLVKYSAPPMSASRCTVRWDSGGIPWPLTARPIVSARDAAGTPFREFLSPFGFDEPGQDFSVD